MNATNATNATPQSAAANTNTARDAFVITAIAGTADAKESATLWTGRQVGKAQRKDLQLSQPLPTITAQQVAALDPEQVAIVLNDEFLAYVRRVKCQRLNIGDKIELMLPVAASEFATMALRMLSAPATRTKKLVSTATVRALLLSATYKAAAAATLGTKLDAWNRVFGQEFAPLATATDARIATTRTTVRDTVVLRCMEIAAVMPESQEKLVLEAVAELLSELEAADLDDSI